MKTKPYKTYNGGKNGSGVYQAIINQIPPHDIFISAFAGNCGVLANKKKALLTNIAIDIDKKVVDDWNNLKIHVQAIQGDARTVIQNMTFGTASPFLFFDPPYLMETRSCKQKLYKNEMSHPAAHIKLLLQLREIKEMVMISHYPCKLYNDYLYDWRHVDIQGRTRNGMRTERLYMNYEAPTELHDYSFIGKNYRDRERLKKAAANAVKKFSMMRPMERNFILSEINRTI